MKQYNRVMAGRGSRHAQRCFDEGFIGTDYGINIDLSSRLSENWREFNREFRPIYLETHPGKSKIAAGLACGSVWTVSKGLMVGDVVISPDGSGRYRAGEITGPYYHAPGEPLQHRRPVTWFAEPFDRSDMSEALRRSTSSTGACCEVTSYADELMLLIGGQSRPTLVATDETIEDPSVFALEKHLQEFLVRNWKQTKLGVKYDIFEEDGELAGQQYPTDTGPIDILAISKDKSELLVVELKKGRASDAVVGQVQRYMGYVLEELAEEGQTVKGVIIALDDDLRIRRALKVANSIEFYRYEVSFTLIGNET